MVAGTTLAQSLAEAIRTGGSLALETVTAPDLAGAYGTQADILRMLDIVPAGYKLSLKADGVLSAPLLSVDHATRFPFQPDMKLEVELALKLAADLPKREAAYTREEIANAVGDVFLGIELVRSRYVGGAQGSVPLLVADLMSTAGYLIGPVLGLERLQQVQVDDALRVDLGDTTVFEAAAAHPDKDPLAGLVAYANEAGRPDDVLKAGRVITTGSLCGGLPVSAPTDVAVSFSDQMFRFALFAPQ